MGFHASLRERHVVMRVITDATEVDIGIGLIHAVHGRLNLRMRSAGNYSADRNPGKQR
jgi:hypothetical protein